MQSNLVKELPRVLTIDGLVKYTGYAKAYIYKLNHQGKIPGASKPGNGKLFFDREKIDEWLFSNPVITNDEKEIKAATYLSTHK